MKNSLQLELQLKIKKANRFLISKQYQRAILQYTQGLKIYQDNKRYNDTVSQQFQSLLYSLRANTYSLNFNAQKAEQNFDLSLKINPYNPVTLSRRAKHFMKQKRYSEAIQDIDLALLYDPQNLTYISLLNSIKNYINEMEDQTSKQQLLTFITKVKQKINPKTNDSQTQSEQEDDQDLLNFSKLKKIDRVSVKINPLKINNRKSVIQFKEDQLLQYQKDQDQNQNTQQKFHQVVSQNQIIDKLKQQDKQLIQLQNQEETQNKQLSTQKLVVCKNNGRIRKSILRKSMIGGEQSGNSIFINQNHSKSNSLKRDSISAISVKNIDGKVVTHEKQKIKFRPSISSLSKSQVNNLTNVTSFESAKQTPSKGSRKSCLRSSKKFQTTDFIDSQKQNSVKRKVSNFFNIKNIDGGYKKNQNNDQKSYQSPVKQNNQAQSSDDDQNQHNIFGKKQSKQIIKILDSNSKGQIYNSQSSKKSILRKNSIIGTSGWKGQKKKSVLFKTS